MFYIICMTNERQVHYFALCVNKKHSFVNLTTETTLNKADDFLIHDKAAPPDFLTGSVNSQDSRYASKMATTNFFIIILGMENNIDSSFKVWSAFFCFNSDANVAAAFSCDLFSFLILL